MVHLSSSVLPGGLVSSNLLAAASGGSEETPKTSALRMFIPWTGHCRLIQDAKCKGITTCTGQTIMEISAMLILHSTRKPIQHQGST